MMLTIIFQKILPPVWFLLSIALMLSLHYWFPFEQLVFPPITYLGIILIAKGIFILFFCAYIFYQKKTTIKPFQESSYLLQEGLFSYSRNPRPLLYKNYQDNYIQQKFQLSLVNLAPVMNNK